MKLLRFEELPLALQRWLEVAKPGDDWKIPEEWMDQATDLQLSADRLIRQRDPTFRVWREVNMVLVCKKWVW